MHPMAHTKALYWQLRVGQLKVRKELNRCPRCERRKIKRGLERITMMHGLKLRLKRQELGEESIEGLIKVYCDAQMAMLPPSKSLN